MLLSRYKTLTLSVLLWSSLYPQSYKDVLFLQDRSIQFEKQKTDIILIGVKTDKNKNINVLSSQGLLSPWEKKLKPNFQYRPLENQKVIAIESHKNQFYYLTQKAVLSNSFGGKFYLEHGLENPILLGIGKDKSFLILTDKGLFFFDKEGQLDISLNLGEKALSVQFDTESNRYLILTPKHLYEFRPQDQSLKKVYYGSGFSSIEQFMEKIWIGSNKGIHRLNDRNFNLEKIIEQLPHVEITSLKNIGGALWAGSTRGAFKFRNDGKYNYYASKRWLADDKVICVEKGPDQSVLILTQKGLSQIVFEPMTLEQKASYFQEIQRKRHIRYGLESSVKLRVAGDLSSLELIDTDNDGLWTSMYLASELFRYAVTQSEDARQNAFEAFEAMERLTTISRIKGFPARTYEIDSYQKSNWNKDSSYGTWKKAKDQRWVWKTTTSSDESCGHFFVYALFAEIIKDKQWKNRAIQLIKKQMDHIIENDWYLVSWDGKPTRWGRWHPDYVNSFPIQVGDRRLNSTLILTFLQTAYHFTKEERYKDHALNLNRLYGYEENACRPASVIGYVEGEFLSNGWNHSDDEMYFLTAPAFVKYAFDNDSRQRHLETVASHWEIERSEKNPLWNFLYAMSGGKDFDLKESILWLKEYPVDLIDWKIENKHRKDLKKITSNFRKQEYSEVLPRDERPHHLHNRAYKNDGGSGGFREYSPYIYLLPYWAGRYVKAIEPASSNTE
tara:strand:+ start:3016 stop:5196 length:2181 start_codon:yes stop_codon:yes gene_type:complete